MLIYLGERLFGSKIIVQTHTYTSPIALPGPPNWLVNAAAFAVYSTAYTDRAYHAAALYNLDSGTGLA